MGRARGYSASHATTSADGSRFDAVLGARRGSASAQATRDAQESQTRENELTEMIAGLDLSSSTVIDHLTAAYRSGGAVVGTPEHKKLCKDLQPAQVHRLRDLAKVAVHGDPEYWPGLTEPALAALTTHLHASPAGGAAGTVTVSRLFRAMVTTDAIKAHANTPEQYERLAPVLEGLAALLHHLPGHENGGGARMAEMLRRAPTSALEGPLQPLVQAFGQRIQDGKAPYSSGEWQALERIVAEQALDSQRTEALRPIVDVLGS